MKILIVGSGGREHALAWKCAQTAEVIVAPGNAGTALEPNVRNVEVESIEDILDMAEEVDLTIIGPETPLAEGIVDRFQERGLPCFGPTTKAAQLESSKIFAKEFLERHNIPTAKYKSFRMPEFAVKYLKEQDMPIVIKADGLAAGKGVIIAHTFDEAKLAALNLLSDHDSIVIEEFLEGEEASFIIMTDGDTILPLATSQDHKARDDGDTGPNTGGMGAYSPAPVVTPELENTIMEEIVEPTLNGLKEDGINYLGFLYIGLMIKDDAIKVLEFNCRLGDPETQVIMVRLNSDLIDLCLATLEGNLQNMTIEWDERPSLGVVMAADGYPLSYRKGDVISGLDDINGKVFHAGTTIIDNTVVTNGGRVLCVVSLGDTIADAKDNAYAQTKQINWNGCFFRNDIGNRAILKTST